MSLPIYVGAYSGYKANERPPQVCVDEDVYKIDEVEEQWWSPDAALFKVRISGGERYMLRYEEGQDQWTLLSDLDGTELFARTPFELITVEPAGIRKAESKVSACERCRAVESEIPFDLILADILDRHGAFEFVLADAANCPNGLSGISEKTLVEPQGGIEVDTSLPR